MLVREALKSPSLTSIDIYRAVEHRFRRKAKKQRALLLPYGGPNLARYSGEVMNACTICAAWKSPLNWLSLFSQKL